MKTLEGGLGGKIGEVFTLLRRQTPVVRFERSHLLEAARLRTFEPKDHWKIWILVELWI
jgi:hypothetical protein